MRAISTITTLALAPMIVEPTSSDSSAVSSKPLTFGLYTTGSEIRDRLAVDLLWRKQRTAREGQAIDAAMLVIALRVAQVVLEVTDEHLRPIHDVERSIRGDGDVHAFQRERFGQFDHGRYNCRRGGRQL